MTTTTAEHEDAPMPHSKLNFLSLLCFCLTTAFLTASVYLILQYKMGIPFNFVTSVALAAAAALVVPICVALLFKKFVRKVRYPSLTGFIVGNLAMAIGTGLFIF